MCEDILRVVRTSPVILKIVLLVKRGEIRGDKNSCLEGRNQLVVCSGKNWGNSVDRRSQIADQQKFGSAETKKTRSSPGYAPSTKRAGQDQKYNASCTSTTALRSLMQHSNRRKNVQWEQAEEPRAVANITLPLFCAHPHLIQNSRDQ